MITYISAVSIAIHIAVALIGFFCIYAAFSQKPGHKGKATGTQILIGNLFLAISATTLNPNFIWVIPSLFWISGIINIMFILKHMLNIRRINREISIGDGVQTISLMQEKREVNKKIRRAIELAGFAVYTGFLLLLTFDIIF